jgi:hypothetical protein
VGTQQRRGFTACAVFTVARKNKDSIQQYINADATARKGRDTWVLIADYRQVIDTHYTVPRG